MGLMQKQRSACTLRPPGIARVACERVAGAQVHGGFLEAYDSVHAQVLRLVDDLTARGGGWRMLCTGHSLGGALCTLLAYELADRRRAAALTCTRT